MQTLSCAVALRALAPQDLDQVVAIDARLTQGQRRRAYFERRLNAARARPELHVQFAADQDGALAGYVLARRLAGEFGRADPALRIEVIGVRPDGQGRGVGRQLLGRLAAFGVTHDIQEIRTQVSWRNHAMVAFLDHVGFDLGRNHVLDRPVHADAYDSVDPAELGAEAPAGGEIDFSGSGRDDFHTLARDRAHMRSMVRNDLAEVVRIDRLITGRERASYLERILVEALSDSGVRVSLVALRDGFVAGYIMAKTDFGDFGRTEPVAVIDTIGVDPALAHQGIGRALLSQLFMNLHALNVERAETIVSYDDLELLRFFYRAGFGPAERLAFAKRLA